MGRARTWRLARGRGVVSLPTGSGKTRVGVAAIAQTGLPALCLVPTRVLLHQWVDRLRALFGEDVGRLVDGCREVRRVTVSTFESAWRQMERIGDRFGLLVVDEAHHFGAGVRDEALEMCVAPFRRGRRGVPVRRPAGRAAPVRASRGPRPRRTRAPHEPRAGARAGGAPPRASSSARTATPGIWSATRGW